jgi:phage terminase large subunit GpA-like protein
MGVRDGGYGEGEERWSIDYKIHYSDPSTPDYWQSLDDHLQRQFQHPTGATLRIEAACVDSGDNTQAVYDFCRPRFSRRVFAIKGPSNSVGKPIWPKKGESQRRKEDRRFSNRPG